MSNTNHTPTPWRVVNGSQIKDELMPFDRDERDTVLIATTAGTATAELAAANAAFIVRACNSHEQLVAALREVTDVLDAFGNLPDGMMHPSPWNERKAEAKVAAARVALAAAEAA